jgi:hypothetical protein
VENWIFSARELLFAKKAKREVVNTYITYVYLNGWNKPTRSLQDGPANSPKSAGEVGSVKSQVKERLSAVSKISNRHGHPKTDHNAPWQAQGGTHGDQQLACDTTARFVKLSTKQIPASSRNDGASACSFCDFGVILSNSSTQASPGFGAT